MPDSITPARAKTELRQKMRTLLRGVTMEKRAKLSLTLCREAAALPAFRVARCVALFASLSSEPDLMPLIEEAWAQAKRVVLPVMRQRDGTPQLDWHAVSNWDEIILSGPFGLREPDPLRCPFVERREIDCAFVPGLAFDDKGNRLGRGGGFYDSFLHHASARTSCIGLFFEYQRVHLLPHESHDHPLPAVLTEEEIRFWKRCPR